MDFRVQSIVILILHVFDTFVSPQCLQRKPPNVKDKEFPNIFDIKGTNYTAKVQINYYYLKQSLLVTEYYNILDSNGRIDLIEGGETDSFIYFNKTNEIFTVKDSSCKSAKLKEFQYQYGKEMFQRWILHENDRSIIGPTAILRKAYLNYKKKKVVYMGKSETSVRGITAEFWQECINDNEINVEYYFAITNWKNEFGEIAPVHVPLRIVAQGATHSDIYPEIFQTYDFEYFEPFIHDDSVLSIPDGKGCLRLTDDLPVCKTLKNRDLSYFAEILYTPENSIYSYITYVNFIYDGDTDHVAFHYTNWSKPFKNGDRQVDEYNLIICNTKNRFCYNIDEDSKQCKVSIEDLDAIINLPNNIELPIGKELYLSENEDFKYLGQKKIRGMNADIFEKTKKLEDTTNIYTRYFVKSANAYEEETPIRVSMKTIADNSGKSVNIMINIYDFSTKIIDKISTFDIDNCFKKSSDNQWISFYFEVSNNEELLRNMEQYVPEIQSKILDMLIDKGELNALRVSKILIDFDVNGMYVSVLILERPNYMLDFEPSKTMYIEDAEETVGMVTKHECAKLCLEYPGMCYAFSHCGKTCYLKAQKTWKEKYQSNCKLHKRSTQFNPYLSIPTTNIILQKLMDAFDSDGFTISLSIKDSSGNNKYVELKVTSFESEGSNPDKNNEKVGDFDKHFTEYKYGYKLKKSAAYVKYRGALTYNTCQRICIADPECESLSSCTGLAECLISKKHVEEIPERDFVTSENCIILSKNYLDAFIRHDGLITSSSAVKTIKVEKQELCAKACLNETDFSCRSFDFCPYSKNSNKTCILHKSHYLDSKENGVIIDESGMCGHYSRNYIYDFKKLKGNSLNEKSLLTISNVAVDKCAKLCVENGGFECGSFDFCQSSLPRNSYCRLNQKAGNLLKTISSSVCDTYYRSRKTEPPPQKKEKYSTGLSAGLGVFFFVLGMGFGVVALLAFGKITGKKI